MVRNFKIVIFKLIYQLGQQYRNPSIKKQLIFLKSTKNWSIEQLENYQLKKLNEILFIAKNSSKYYNKILKNNQLDTLKDIENLPILTKELLLDNINDIHSKNKFKKKYKATTSGTSGKTLQFFRDEVADSFNRASILNGYYWFKVKPWERNGYFWGINFNRKNQLKSKFLDFIQNRFRVFSYQENEIKQFAKKMQKAKYIHGYSSMIYETALLINKLKLPKPNNIKMVKGTSEKIFSSYQKEIETAFGRKMISEYGATETGIIAFECPKGSMHLNMEGVLVEEINNEILVTNLQMTSFPIIRYKLGDYIKLAPKGFECSCGRKHRVLEEVTGRVGENVVGFINKYPTLYFYYIFKNLSSNFKIDLNYQVVQEKKGKLLFLIEQELVKGDKEKLEMEILKYFKKDITFTIIDSANFIVSKKGKLKSFISKI